MTRDELLDTDPSWVHSANTSPGPDDIVEEASGGKKSDGGKPRPSLFPREELREILLNRQRLLPEGCTPEWEDLWIAYLEGETDRLASFVLTKEAPDTPSLARFLRNVLSVLEFGAKKYGEYNWRKVSPERYVDAIGRHLLAVGAGEELDEDTGMPHTAHVLCNCLFLAYLREDPCCTDGATPEDEPTPDEDEGAYRMRMVKTAPRSDTYEVRFRDGFRTALGASSFQHAIDKADALARERGLL